MVTKINIRVSHPRMLRMLNSLQVRLEITDNAYSIGVISINHIKHANSELIALLQALIKELEESSTPEGIQQILKENKFRKK